MFRILRALNSFLTPDFLRGVAAACGVTVLVQDLMGLEGFIEHLRAHWISIPWWMTTACLLLILAAQIIETRRAAAAQSPDGPTQ